MGGYKGPEKGGEVHGGDSLPWSHTLPNTVQNKCLSYPKFSRARPFFTRVKLSIHSRLIVLCWSAAALLRCPRLGLALSVVHCIRWLLVQVFGLEPITGNFLTVISRRVGASAANCGIDAWSVFWMSVASEILDFAGQRVAHAIRMVYSLRSANWQD